MALPKNPPEEPLSGTKIIRPDKGGYFTSTQLGEHFDRVALKLKGLTYLDMLAAMNMKLYEDAMEGKNTTHFINFTSLMVKTLHAPIVQEINIHSDIDEVKQMSKEELEAKIASHMDKMAKAAEKETIDTSKAIEAKVTKLKEVKK